MRIEIPAEGTFKVQSRPAGSNDYFGGEVETTPSIVRKMIFNATKVYAYSGPNRDHYGYMLITVSRDGKTEFRISHGYQHTEFYLSTVGMG